MAEFGIEAALAQFDSLLENGTSGLVPLSANLKKMEHNDTPHLDLTAVLFAHHAVGKVDWPEAMETGPVITTSDRIELALSRFMAEGSIEGSAGYIESSRAIIGFARVIRNRYMQPSNWASDETGITLLRDFRMVGRALKRQEWRLEFRYQFDIVIDEEPTY